MTVRRGIRPTMRSSGPPGTGFESTTHRRAAAANAALALSMSEPDAVAKMYEAAPLIRFSVYTHGQVAMLRELGNEVLGLLNSSMSDSKVDGMGFIRAYNLFWLWVLGAFEVARTMCKARRCFDRPLANEICGFKKRLALLRTPFAKQELPSKRKRFSSEASVVGLDTTNKDMSFEVEGQILSAKVFIESFQHIFGSIQLADVTQDLMEK
jgi:hypothetical protein